MTSGETGGTIHLVALPSAARSAVLRPPNATESFQPIGWQKCGANAEMCTQTIVLLRSDVTISCSEDEKGLSMALQAWHQQIFRGDGLSIFDLFFLGASFLTSLCVTTARRMNDSSRQRCVVELGRHRWGGLTFVLIEKFQRWGFLNGFGKQQQRLQRQFFSLALFVIVAVPLIRTQEETTQRRHEMARCHTNQGRKQQTPCSFRRHENQKANTSLLLSILLLCSVLDSDVVSSRRLFHDT